MHARPSRRLVALPVLVAGILVGCASTPDPAPTSVSITTVATGVPNSAALLSDGSLYTWGSNGAGQLGDGTTTSRSTPTRVPGFPPSGTAIAQLAVGANHVAVLLDDGSLRAWGRNDFGQLGDGTTTTRTTPIAVPNFPPANTTITAIAAGGLHSAALLDDGRLYTWGRNDFGQLGDGTETSRSTPTLVPNFPLAGTTITTIALGHDNSAVLLDDGSVHTWGRNGFGQMGDGSNDTTPTPVRGFPPTGTTITSLVAGGLHFAALLDDGSLHTWGYNAFGQLGDGSTTESDTPTGVPGFPPAGTTIAAIGTGYYHTAALLDDGTLRIWGFNGNGTLGDGTLVQRNVPTAVPNFPPPGTKVTAIALGGFHTFALLDDQSLYAWGANYAGQLGDGTLVERTVPTRVPDFPPVGTASTSAAWRVGR